MEFGRLISLQIFFFFFFWFLLNRLGGIEVGGESESLDICQNVSLC